MPAIFSRGEKLENGHYTVVKEIGVGGMGVVYHCRDEVLTRDVAIKMLLPELMSDKKNLEVFRQEARLAAQLEHPNLVTVYDIGVEERQATSLSGDGIFDGRQSCCSPARFASLSGTCAQLDEAAGIRHFLCA